MVRLPAVPGGRPALLDAVHRFADELRGSPKTEAFVISLDPADEDVVWLYEWFIDEDGLMAHQRTEAFATLMQEMPGLLAGAPAIMRIDPLRIDLSNDLLSSDGLGTYT